MGNNICIYTELLEIIHQQEDMINKQNKIISNLVMQNLEKENIVNVLMKESI